MISAIELEKYITSADIFDIVIGKLHYGKKPCLIILFKVDKSLEIDFHRTILPLSLAIRLQVKGGRESPLDVEEIA